MYLSVIVFNIIFHLTLSSNCYRSCINLNHPIIDGFERYYEVEDVVGHESGGMIAHSNEEIIRSHLEFMWPLTCILFFFV